MLIRRHELSDAEWEFVRPLLPVASRQATVVGRVLSKTGTTTRPAMRTTAMYVDRAGAVLPLDGTLTLLAQLHIPLHRVVVDTGQWGSPRPQSAG
ncbi:hypothetical protein [Streptomyces malaysiensis]|uniref:hypothetical protein n=1 Tax=Streptomyces malaysiensis TaxID=92644 RepID=UPI000BFB7FF3